MTTKKTAPRLYIEVIPRGQQPCWYRRRTAISFLDCTIYIEVQHASPSRNRNVIRLLRRMRAFASGLGASSDSSAARLLHLSSEACRLLVAYRSDPSWSTESLSAITLGGTAARALVGWAMELERVYAEQPRVENFLRCVRVAHAWIIMVGRLG